MPHARTALAEVLSVAACSPQTEAPAKRPRTAAPAPQTYSFRDFFSHYLTVCSCTGVEVRVLTSLQRGPTEDIQQQQQQQQQQQEVEPDAQTASLTRELFFSADPEMQPSVLQYAC